MYVYSKKERNYCIQFRLLKGFLFELSSDYQPQMI